MSKDAFDHVVSLGGTCVVAHQIHRFFGATHRHFFDWVVTPLPALIKTLSDDFNGILEDESLEYADARKISLRDRNSGIYFYHDFPLTGNQITADFQTFVPQARAAYERRARRFRDSLRSGARPLFIRYETVLPERLEDEHADLMSQLYRFTSKPVVVWATLDAEKQVDLASGVICRVEDGQSWKGDDRSWDEVFNCALQRFGGDPK